jgi:hydroxymethylpyrimidine pyrophosphatase-like HAD family hydrolase
MYKGWVFVDVDGTLIDKDDNPRPFIRELFEGLKKLNLILVIWSGGGEKYARHQVAKISVANPHPVSKGYDIFKLVDEFRWKGTPVTWTHIRPVFFIDDSKFIEQEHAEDGSEVFRVPFYEASIMENDPWLLRALHAAEKFYNQYGSGGHKKTLSSSG